MTLSSLHPTCLMLGETQLTASSTSSASRPRPKTLWATGGFRIGSSALRQDLLHTKTRPSDPTMVEQNLPEAMHRFFLLFESEALLYQNLRTKHFLITFRKCPNLGCLEQKSTTLSLFSTPNVHFTGPAASLLPTKETVSILSAVNSPTTHNPLDSCI